MSRSALILAGHGSHLSANTAGIVWDTVDSLRRMNVADEITAAFWKELPSFATVLDGIEAPDVTIIPLFTAQGYFTRSVIPAEMGLDPAILHGNPHARPSREDETISRLGARPQPAAREKPQRSRVIRYARTLGEHPGISQIVRDRVDNAIGALGVPPDQVAIAVIGHSTSRNPDSRKATEAQAMLLRGAVPVREVVAVYLDDTPAIPDVYAMTTAPYIIAVPYFLAAGSHTTYDVPAALGLIDSSGGYQERLGQRETSAVKAGQVNGRTVIYTQPLGTKTEIARMALDLARNAGAPLNTMYPVSPWNAFPAAGFDATRQLLAAAPTQLGQLLITSSDLRHIDDAGRTDLTTLDTPAALRRAVREQPFRKLATTTDLPGGWYLAISGDAALLHMAIETVYPGVMGTSQRMRQNGIDPLAWPTVFARQTGQYRALGGIDAAERAAVTVRVCGQCILTPLWADATVVDGMLLCREPCNAWLSDAMTTKEEPE